MLHITLHHACSANIWTDANIRRARMARTGVCLQLNIPPSQILVHLVHAQFNVGEPSDCGETYFWLSSTAPPPISKWSVRRLISRFPPLFYFIWWILWIWYCWSTASTQYADKPHTDKINDKPSNHYDAREASQLNQLFQAFPKVLGIMGRPITLEFNLFYLKDNTQYPKNAVKQYASSKNS